MTAFRLERTVAAAPAEAWRRVTDWRAHAALMPWTALTSMVPEPPGPGTVFVVRTGVGRAGFDDPMEIVEWSPPGGAGTGRCRLAKRGRVVRGWAVVEVRPEESGSGSVVVWTEELRLPGVPDRPVAWVGRALFGRALDALLRDPE
ncbi:SRPBCC family protein [Streptomyces qinzhouensis]|uniref:SRPBCC family protein n=1 Tax=Streptomyces qinzhouensis TaxID=2599401 RepID=A0A5B8J2N9_9ACTN|nr:SRPBCC family protein [Streptomyces qinzhouensis]QDY75477.1 SRPBCC family protein [Streptomyces qinzhouensis]